MSLSLLELGSGRMGRLGDSSSREQTEESFGCFFQQPGCWVNVCGARARGGLGRRAPRPPASQRKKAQNPCFARTPPPPTHHQSWERGSPERSSGQAAT